MSTTADAKGPVHKEAYCLMWYGCRCGHCERIWNSRDGVTPFAMVCPSCGKDTLSHVVWSSDTPAPDHKLHPRQRFWRDGTKEEAVAIMRARIDSCKGTQFEVKTQERVDEILASIDDATGEFQPGWPMLDMAK